MLYSTVYDPQITSEELNHDLGCIHQWAHQWNLEFNPHPTKQAHEVLFSRISYLPRITHLLLQLPRITQQSIQDLSSTS